MLPYICEISSGHLVTLPLPSVVYLQCVAPDGISSYLHGVPAEPFGLPIGVWMRLESSVTSWFPRVLVRSQMITRNLSR